MPLAILVVDRRRGGGASAERPAGSSGSLQVDGEQRLGLVEQEAAVAIGTARSVAARASGGEREVAADPRAARRGSRSSPSAAASRRWRISTCARLRSGGVELEGRVLGRRADQRDGAVLDVGEEAVLLRAVEAVDLVHEQQRAACRVRAWSRASANAFLRSATPEKTAEIWRDKRRPTASASRRAIVVLPVPGGPQRMIDDRRPAATIRPIAPSGAGEMLLADDLGQASAGAGGRRAGRRRRAGSGSAPVRGR
jgi:hypothetical protein